MENWDPPRNNMNSWGGRHNLYGPKSKLDLQVQKRILGGVKAGGRGSGKTYGCPNVIKLLRGLCAPLLSIPLRIHKNIPLMIYYRPLAKMNARPSKILEPEFIIFKIYAIYFPQFP